MRTRGGDGWGRDGKACGRRWWYFELLVPLVGARAIRVFLVIFLTPCVLTSFPFVCDWGKDQFVFFATFGVTIAGFWIPVASSLLSFKQLKI